METNVPVINARDLLQFSTDQLWEKLPVTPHFVLVFDDEEKLLTNWKQTVLSSYAWKYHQEFPKTPLLAKHHIGKILGKKRYNPKTHLNLIGSVMWTVFDANPGVDRDYLARQAYVITNTIYNEMSIRIEEYVSTLTIKDFIEVINNERIRQANNEVKPTEDSIQGVYEVIHDTLEKDVSLYNNPLARASRSGIVNNNQLNQCLGPRGFLTDTGSEIFKKPILRGYIHGLRLFHDSLIESRSAAKSLMFAKKPLQDAEYFSRRLQLLSMVVQNLHQCDCGSEHYMTWQVSHPVEKKGKLEYTDLENMAGKFYLDEATGKLKVIHADDHFLAGKTIKLRSPHLCQHPDPYGFCVVCFGELGYGVPAHSNIGHMTSSSFTHDSSQLVLSVKHFDGSSTVDPIIINAADSKYFTISNDGNSYIINKNLKGKLKLVFKIEQAEGVADVNSVKEVEDLNISHVSSIDYVCLMVEDGKRFEEVAIAVGFEHRKANLTYDALKYIKQNGYSTDGRGNYVVDLSEWDRSKKLMTLPLKHYNMSDHSRDLAAMLESTVSEMKRRDKVVSPTSFIREVYDLANNKLNVNLAVIETIVYGIMVQSAEDFNYHLPKPWTDRGIGVREALITNRSAGALMAYKGHREFLLNPISYMLKDRPNHPMDHFLMPYEVLQENQ